jgi:hypothetical protein
MTMPDEIDLLREFRADTPGPDDTAWERVRAAVALAESADAVPSPGARERRAPGIRGIRVGRVTKGQVRVAAAAALVALVVTTVLQPPPTLTAPLVSAWQPARQLPSGSAGVKAGAGTWRLTGYLVAEGWQENSSGPGPGSLTCPTAATCYVEGNSAKSPSGPSDVNSFYVSTDGARTWSVLPVPAGVTFTSALSCASEIACAAGGLYYGHQPVYISTGNGGHSWTVRPLPAAVGQIIKLACATATDCRGLSSATGKTITPGIGTMYAGTRFFATSDGGRRVTVVRFPSYAVMQSVACPTASHCVAVGVFSKFSQREGPDADHGVLLTSDDGGLTWQRHTWPKRYGPGWEPEVTCSDASHCAMIGFVEHDGIERFAYGYTSGKDAVQYTVIGFSADGGKTWPRTSGFPRSMPYTMINDLTCPTSTTCYAAGADAIAEHIGNTYNDGSAVVGVTQDAGRTWQRVTFAVPAQVPSGMQGDSFMDIGQIQCPQADACVAIGISDQGSTSTPIYTNHG